MGSTIAFLAGVSVLCVAGVVAATAKALAIDISTARRATLAILAVLLTVAALAFGAAAYWAWRFTVEFTF